MKHYIIVKFKEEADQKELVPRIRELFESAGQIAGGRKAQVYSSAYQLASRYDLMVCIDLKKGGLNNLVESDLYQSWKEEYSPYIEKETIFDAM